MRGIHRTSKVQSICHRRFVCYLIDTLNVYRLSELKSIGYGKDKTLLDEQERRRQQQLVLMQHHRDIASLLPPEAAAQLVHDANYTLCKSNTILLKNILFSYP